TSARRSEPADDRSTATGSAAAIPSSRANVAARPRSALSGALSGAPSGAPSGVRSGTPPGASAGSQVTVTLSRQLSTPPLYQRGRASGIPRGAAPRNGSAGGGRSVPAAALRFVVVVVVEA